MANSLYAKARERFATAQLSWTADTIKALCVDTTVYTLNLTTHQYVSDVTGIVTRTGALASKTAALGVVDAADITITGVTGNPFQALIFFKDTGSDATSPLIAYFDTGVIGLPAFPNGGDMAFIFNPSGIFRL